MIDSADPVVQRLAQRHSKIGNDIRYLETALRAYAMSPLTCDAPRASVSPLEHYNMLDAPDCGCGICLDWETRRKEFTTVVSLVPKDHKWTVCSCSICRFVGRIQLNYLAAANRRDLMISMSYHARYHSTHPDVVMAWFDTEMRRPDYTTNWCAQEMGRFPVERWMKRCEMAVSGIVSGAVFRASAMKTDFITSFGSSLLAETDVYAA